jgi:hypothetical protein
MARLPLPYTPRKEGASSPIYSSESQSRLHTNGKASDSQAFFEDPRNLSELNLVGSTKQLIIVGKYKEALGKLNLLVELLHPEPSHIVHNTSQEALSEAAGSREDKREKVELKKEIIEIISLLSDRKYDEARTHLLEILATFGDSSYNFQELIVEGKQHLVGLSKENIRLLLLGRN